MSATGEPLLATTLVLAGDDPVRARVAAVLAAAERPAPAVGPADVDELPEEALVVLAVNGRALERARAVQAILELRPDLLVVAVMPDEAPNAPLRRALQAGATGLVREADLADALVATVDAIVAGQMAVPRELGAIIAPRALSHREKQILGLVAEGCTNREIAGRLYIAESTVKTHLSSAFEKLDATSRADAIERLLDLETVQGQSRKIQAGQGV